jgi:hypothetical protein
MISGLKNDLSHHETHRVQPMAGLAIGQRDQQRHDRKQKDGVAAEDNAVGAAALAPSTANARPGPI